MTTTKTIINFADGRTFEVPKSWNDPTGSKIKGLDADGYPMALTDFGNDSWFIGLTMCCGASFKGCEGYVGCRSCYEPAEGNDMPWGDVSPLVAS